MSVGETGAILALPGKTLLLSLALGRGWKNTNNLKGILSLPIASTSSIFLKGLLNFSHGCIINLKIS